MGCFWWRGAAFALSVAWVLVFVVWFDLLMIDLSFGGYVCGLSLIGLVFGLRVLIWGF